MMKSIFSILCLLVGGTAVYAQQLVGIVVDSEQLPISKVHIINNSNGSHTHSDENGRFLLLDVSINDTLQLSHLAYAANQYVVKSLDAPLILEMSIGYISLSEIVIAPQVDVLSLFTEIDLKTNPVNSSQEILRKVPGLFIGQHAGGGKAEQLFLRGFDIDHGTDIAINVDGMPVNMVSHAHGQGYADLHFIIPETIDDIDFAKGPYSEKEGNFNTAGNIGFQTKDRIGHNLLKLEAGQFNNKRLLSMIKLLDAEEKQLYLASEVLFSDGPFESPQNFNRINVFAKYSQRLANNYTLKSSLSHFSSSWLASGQIPDRLVQDGTIGRFGAVDDTEGGSTSRTNAQVSLQKQINAKSIIENTFFFSHYDFTLFSNFTFFLNDPENGDQIKQKESRNLFGLKTKYQQQYNWREFNGFWHSGIAVRTDQVTDNELSRTKNRKELIEPVALGDVNETNFSGFIGSVLNYRKLSFHPSLRIDHFLFQYTNALTTAFDQQQNGSTVFSPNFTMQFNQSKNLQIYYKVGQGFHSNDTRVVLENRTKESVPKGTGMDFGMIWKPRSRLVFNIALWNLNLAQEFVYVGDEGVVEASGESKRRGVDLSTRAQLNDWAFFNLDMNYTHARQLTENGDQEYIPLAPEFNLVTGFSVRHPSGIYGGIHARVLGDRAAKEDNSIIAEGYTIVDANLGYNYKKIGLGMQVQNLLNAEWNETQFATTTQLPNEILHVEEIHFTPGTPFFAKASIEFRF